YWKWLIEVPAHELIAHRILWSFVLLLSALLIMGQWRNFRASLANRRLLLPYLLASILLSINWLIYVWSVNSGQIIEASLGYFINPLVSVMLGVLFLHEQLRRLQWLAIGLAALGVLYLSVMHGQIPWIALSLACSFGLYGLIKKKSPLEAVQGLTLETALLLLPALGYLFWLEARGSGHFPHGGTLQSVLLIGAGLVTTLPLLLFAQATRQVPLSVIGMLQYITPIMQLLIGLWFFQEPFGPEKVLGYALVWLALLLFMAEGLLYQHRRRKAWAGG
ncbi:MAG: EamA family transporter RarD, partial [Thiothrix sp.]|nr:EamA family transporter RarD [Thiothrix sp.]